MDLHPDLAEAALRLPPTDLTDVAAARGTNAERRPVAPYRRAGEAKVEDVVIDGPGGALAVRVYRPSAGVTGPTVLWVHGGAFIMGTLDSSDAVCSQLAVEAGALVVNVDYRLAPEHPYPAGVEDSYAALEWLAQEARALGGSAEQLVVAGSSAGGCIAAAVALRARDQGGPRLARQVLVQPVLDHRGQTPSATSIVESPVFTATSNRIMWRTHLGGGPADAYASPALAEDVGGLPPAYITAAARDPLRDEAIAYASRLLQAGVDVELHVYPGAFHGFDSLVPEAPLSQRANDDLVRAVAQTVHELEGASR
ncbi:alpha/beta hydrolase [Pedococcus sp. 5OH_020]|uniref:alpha/beta hydrolase n=1 Tax=Pedococcus sp. 5OH_020 TaxID=2989814 RepID=UPI0022EA0D67|nr:alpha/beta hydrolase [Pedococcus sp. 5OH_020]